LIFREQVEILAGKKEGANSILYTYTNSSKDISAKKKQA